jgi:restriction system protein
MKNIMEEIEEKREFLIKQSLENNRKHPEKWRHLYQKLKIEISKHAPALLRNFRNSYKENEYDAIVKDERGAEISRFFFSVNLYEFEGIDPYCAQKASRLVQRWCEIQFRKLKETDAAPDNGHDFEHWVAAKLEQAGWTASVTQASGDDGVDVIAEREGLSVAVQCKRFKGSVGNKAVQEVYSGMKHMQLDRAVVISTGQYTKAAKNLARTTGVLLLSEYDILHLWDLLQK